MDDYGPIDLLDERPSQPEDPVSPEPQPLLEEAGPRTEPLSQEVPSQPEEPVQPEECPVPEEPAQPEECPVPEESPQPEEAHDMLQETLDRVAEAASQISGQLESLSGLFQKRIMYAAHEEKVIDQMHKELQRYKEGLYAQLVRPILLDIIEVRDSIMRVGAVYREKPEGEQAIPNRTFSDYAYDLQDILEKNNVEIYRSQSGDPFSPLRQRAVKKVAVEEAALHGKVAESLSCGYGCDGRVLSAEKVSVYTYEKPAEHEEIDEASEEPAENEEVNEVSENG